MIHSKGPWFVVETPQDKFYIMAVGSGDRVSLNIATVTIGPCYKENARLIGATPDLLIAAHFAYGTIQDCIRTGDYDFNQLVKTVEILEEAIAKAKGENDGS